MFDGDETAEQIRARRGLLKNEYGQIFNKISELLFRHDPIGINFEDNADEYDPEVGTILPRLRTCTSSDDVLSVVYEEFQKWFNGEAGAKENYQDIALEIWSIWLDSGVAKN